LTYGTRGQLPALVRKEGFAVRHVRTRRTIRAIRGVGGPQLLTHLVVSNYDIARKRFDELEEEGWEIDPAEESPRTVAQVPAAVTAEAPPPAPEPPAPAPTAPHPPLPAASTETPAA